MNDEIKYSWIKTTQVEYDFSMIREGFKYLDSLCTIILVHGVRCPIRKIYLTLTFFFDLQLIYDLNSLKIKVFELFTPTKGCGLVLVSLYDKM